MLALRCAAPPRLDPGCPEPSRASGEALIALRVAGVCDTDLQLARGYMGFTGILGHEFVGEVLDADRGELIGARVVADINAGCGACEDCRTRDGHHCAARSVLGIVARDGALAERFTVPERALVQVPREVPDERAVFAEPLAAALHVLDDLPATGAEPVAVLGDGKLGLLIAYALVAAGRRVLVVGHHAEKLALARHGGAETVLEHELGRDLRVPAVVEATGSASGLARALALVRPRGCVILKTTVAGATAVDLSPIVVNELHVVGSRCGDMAQAVALLARGLDPTPLISARYPLARADEALARAARPGTLKVLVEAGAREPAAPTPQ